MTSIEVWEERKRQGKEAEWSREDQSRAEQIRTGHNKPVPENRSCG
jgi:hypothetical protein